MRVKYKDQVLLENAYKSVYVKEEMDAEQKMMAGLLKPGDPEYERRMAEIKKLKGDNAAARSAYDAGAASREEERNTREADFQSRMQKIQADSQAGLDKMVQQSQEPQAPATDPQRDKEFAGQMQQSQASQQAALNSLQGQAQAAAGGAQPKVSNFEQTFGLPLTDKGMAAWSNKDENERNQAISSYKQYVKSMIAKDPKLAPIANSPVAAKLVGL